MFKNTYEFSIIEVPVDRDQRGWGFDPYRMNFLSPKHSQHLHIVSLLPHQKRGNHYHNNQNERILVMGGSIVEIIWGDSEGRVLGKVEKNCLHQPIFCNIPAKISHVFYNPGPDTIYLCCFSNLKEFNPAEETVHVQLWENSRES